MSEKKQYEKPKITREQLEEELLAANERLWEANRRLKREEEVRLELFSNLSHDLRSPLAALVSSVAYLKVKLREDDLETRNLLALMERRLNNMQTLINDMFLLTKVESASLQLHPETVDCCAFLEEFFYEREADTFYEGRELQLDIAKDLRAGITIDPEQMIRVLDNLFVNAVKYSGQGAVICLSACVEGTAVVIAVKDTGIGIAEDDIPFVFDRSYRVTKARTPGDSSSGLGLAIAKGIVEQHGGTISCESREGEGSRFEIRLPIAGETA